MKRSSDRHTAFNWLPRCLTFSFQPTQPPLSSVFPSRAAPLPKDDTEVLDVAIVGGGIGGLATALALQKLAPELSFCLYERSPILRGGEGTALTLWPNGLSALGTIDAALLTQVRLVEVGEVSRWKKRGWPMARAA
jgi:hypothetical protein